MYKFYFKEYIFLFKILLSENYKRIYMPFQQPV